MRREIPGGNVIAFRFLHTADLHLDSPLRSLALKDSELAGLIGNASRSVFESIVGICLEERLDALLIAGDLFDGTLRSVKTAAYLSRQFRRLDEAGISVYMIRGNHDAEASAVTKQLDLPPSVHVFSGKGGMVRLDDKGVAIHGISFAKKTMPETSLPKFKSPADGLINIGLMHTSIGGSEGHDVYAPVSLAALAAHGFDYWALGHIHKRKVHHENPFIVMPGIPQGRDTGEAGPKSVTLVTADENGIRIEERLTALAEFSAVTIDVRGLKDIEAVRTAIRDAIRTQSEATQSEHAVLRMTLTGQTPLAWRIRRDAELLAEEARQDARETGNVWIEKLYAAPSVPAHLSAKSDTAGPSPVAELEALMRDSIITDEGFCAEADKILSARLGKLPPSLRDHFGKDEAGRKNILDRLLREGCTDVIAALETANLHGED